MDNFNQPPVQPGIRGNRLEDELAALRMTNIELLETLGAVVDSLNGSTLNHSTQVALYAVAIARVMGLPDVQQERVFKAALVHDVGMICVNSAALSSADHISVEEMERLRLHPTIGGEIIARITNLRDLAPLVHYHHERYDGTGYPDRMQGEEIPIGARIIALADSIDSMLTGRPGRQPYSLSQVIHEVQYYAGSQFDPQVVQAFLILSSERGETFFSSSNSNHAQNMLLQTLGISTGRAAKIMQNQP
jgi:HD-GYP domain-containing protein (c-di-GMP phosphodiesterase class II)